MSVPRGLDGELSSLAADTLARLRDAAARYRRLRLASSMGAEDMVLTDMVVRAELPIDVFTLDTGRLPAETYELMQRVREHYGLRIAVYFPDATEVEEYVREHGVNGFFSSPELRRGCCHVRKVAPLARALDGADAWITGLRREQAVTRSRLEYEQFDPDHGLYKLSPLADWTDAGIWAYIRAGNVPYNALHDRHFPSIGCAPCTRAITAGEDIRAGRWWWEQPQARECGLHPLRGAANG
jgi:phosphoadenosine phosphosulfate reductase